MKLLKSFIILALVSLLGIIVYVYVYQVGQEQKAREAEERMLVRFDLDSIASFALVKPDTVITFERSTGSLWKITEPITAEADWENLYDLFAQLNETEILLPIEATPSDYGQYGLAQPGYYLAMTYQSLPPDTLFIGNPTPDGTLNYVRFSSEQRVLAIDISLANRIKRPLILWRSLTALNVVQSDITAIDIMRGLDDQIILANTGSSWIMQKPWELTGNSENIEILLKDIQSATKREIVSERADDAELTAYGFDNPSAILTVSLKYGMSDKILLIGNQYTESGYSNLRYAKRFALDEIFAIDNALYKHLTIHPEWYIMNQTVRINREDVNRIVLETAGNKITFLRDQVGNWSVTEPLDKIVEMLPVNIIWGLTGNLFMNRMYRYEPTPEDFKETGLTNPTAVISLYRNDTLLDAVSFGKTFLEDTNKTYFRTARTPSLYITTASVTGDLNNVLRIVFGN